MSKVSIVQSDSYDEIKEVIAKSVDLLGGFDQFVKKGDKVILKPNVVRYIKNYPTVTEPQFVAASAELVSEQTDAGEVIVADSPTLTRTARMAFTETGYRDLFDEKGIKVRYLDEDIFMKVSAPGSRVYREMMIPKSIIDCDCLINLPKLKTHIQAYMTVCIKNLHGITHHEERRKFHMDDLGMKLVDIYRAFPPALNIVDGIEAMHGNGPSITGEQVDLGVVVAGADAVAVDAVCTAVMGFEPFKVDTTRIANHYGLGIGDLDKIEVLGAQIEDVKKECIPPDMSLEGAFDKVEIFAGALCMGCRSRLRFSLDIAKKVGALEKVIKRDKSITFLAGLKTSVPEELFGKVYVIGDCAREHKERGEFLPGCPPWFTDVSDALKERGRLE